MTRVPPALGLLCLALIAPLTAQHADGGVSHVRAALADVGLEGAVLATPARDRASGARPVAVTRVTFVRRTGWDFETLRALVDRLDAIDGLCVHDATIPSRHAPPPWTIGPDDGARPLAGGTLKTLLDTLEPVAGLRVEHLHLERGRARWHWSGPSAGTLLEGADALAGLEGIQALALSDPIRTGGRSHGTKNVLRMLGTAASARTPEEMLGRIAVATGVGAALRFRSEPEADGAASIRRVWVQAPSALGFGPWSRWLGGMGPGSPHPQGPASSIAGLGREGLAPVPWNSLHEHVWVELDLGAREPPEARATTFDPSIDVRLLRSLLQTADPRGDQARIGDLEVRSDTLAFELITAELPLVDRLCHAAREHDGARGMELLGVGRRGDEAVYRFRIIR